jgi:hypothetical protein
VGKCTLDGESVDDSFITGMGSAAGAMALSQDQSKLFVTDNFSDTIGEYDAASGAAINAALITGLSIPTGIAIAGSHIYVANAGAGTIGEYNLDATVVNAALVTGLSGGYGLGHIAVLGNSLYVTDIGRGVVGEYDATTGATINAALISGLHGPTAIAVVPEPATAVLALVGVLGTLALARCARSIRVGEIKGVIRRGINHHATNQSACLETKRLMMPCVVMKYTSPAASSPKDAAAVR